jgi:hypothetical protein
MWLLVNALSRYPLGSYSENCLEVRLRKMSAWLPKSSRITNGDRHSAMRVELGLLERMTSSRWKLGDIVDRGSDKETVCVV